MLPHQWIVADADSAAPSEVRFGRAVILAPRTRPSLTRTQQAVKYAADICFSCCLLIVLSPLLAIVALVVALESPGPIIFRQRRTGLCGEIFYIYKFRTMSVVEDGLFIRQAVHHDSRVTRVGRILRRYSIDELPQLFNVLKGEMSLVGPRPHALAHDDVYRRVISVYGARHSVKPGITGWAQINGWRGGTPDVNDMLKRIEFDLWYINHWSLWLDVKILFLTLPELYRTANAY